MRIRIVTEGASRASRRRTGSRPRRFRPASWGGGGASGPGPDEW